MNKLEKVYSKNLGNLQGKINKDVWDAYLEDLGSKDQTTSAVLPEKTSAEAVVLAEQKGVVSGIREAVFLCKKLGLKTRILKKDGDSVSKGQRVLEIQGDAAKILSVERTLLNVIMRMSGISTEVKKLVEKTRGKTKIACTRKTAPGCLFLDKKAVQLGGGLTHRLGLFDGVLIKDNHLAALEKKTKNREQAIKKAVSRAKKQKLPVIVETENFAEVQAALEAGSDAVMLDNMTPGQIKKVLRKVGKTSALFEASGGISEKNLKQYAATGVDVVSMGSLLHSAKSLGFKLEFSLGKK